MGKSSMEPDRSWSSTNEKNIIQSVNNISRLALKAGKRKVDAMKIPYTASLGRGMGLYVTKTIAHQQNNTVFCVKCFLV